MGAGHRQEPIRVSGHIEDKRGIYRIILNWTDHTGKRCRRSISTELPVRKNKKNAEDMLREARKQQELIIASMPDLDEMLFADFMEQWLDVIRPDVKLTTFGGYQMNVQRVIAPYFRERGILLRDLTADDVNAFYAAQLRTVKATSVHKYHANIGKALKYALLKDYIDHNIMEKVKRPKPERM